MKRFVTTLAFIAIFSFYGTAQNKYHTLGGEIIFSWADLGETAPQGNLKTRFTIFFHLQSLYHYDFNKNFGVMSGISIRNVGFVYDDVQNFDESGDAVKKKFRTYTAGIPVGLKFGNLNGAFLFGGYEIEFPFHYKEKTFKNEQKDKFTVWFSDRHQSIFHTVFAGVNFASGVSVKFKYYLTEFFNQNFTETQGGIETQPYSGFEANLFYVSLNFNLFRNTNFYYSSEVNSDKLSLSDAKWRSNLY